MVNSHIKPDVNQLNQAFEKTLAAGVKALPQQVRYVLALSQVNAVQSTTTANPETPLTITEAQLWSMVKFADGFSPQEKQDLLKRVKAIPEDDVRLQLTLELLPKISSYISSSTLEHIWGEVQHIPNMATRSQLMLRVAANLPYMLIDDHPISKPLSNIMQGALTLHNTEAKIRALIAIAPHLPEGMKAHIFGVVLDELVTASSDTLRANIINAVCPHLPSALHQRAYSLIKSIQNPAERARALTAYLHLTESKEPLLMETLNTIEQILGEDERGTALMTCIPHLDIAKPNENFPQSLQKALSIAISFSRRLIRAKALVALAPHLTADLQGEALAAVNNLSSEQERAILLGELAPNLPQNMLVASLVVAHTMREQDARVHALTILVRYAPEQARNQTQLDALAAAANLPNHFERVIALVSLGDVLPSSLLDQTFTNALEATRLIENENARARALCLLGHHLPENLLLRALEEAHQLNDSQQRINALTNIIPRLPDSARQTAITQTLDYIQQLQVGYKQSRALINLAPHLTADDVEKTLGLIETIHDPFDRITAQIALLPHMTQEQQLAIHKRMSQQISRIDEGYDRASALAALTNAVPPSAALAKQAEQIIKSITDDYDCASAIVILAPLLEHGETAPQKSSLTPESVITQGILTTLEIPQQSLRHTQLENWTQYWLNLEEKTRFQLWQAVAHKLTKLPLADTLLCLGVLKPVFSTFGEIIDVAHILGVR